MPQTFCHELMKPLSVQILAAVLFVSHAWSDPKPLFKSTQAFVAERLPEINLKDASFDEAIAELERVWTKQFPELEFPIAEIEYERVEGKRGDIESSITLSLRDLPYYEAFKYIAILSGRSIKNVNNLIVAEQGVWIEESHLSTRVVPVSKKALEFLEITREMKSKEIMTKLESVGIRFPHGIGRNSQGQAFYPQILS